MRTNKLLIKITLIHIIAIILVLYYGIGSNHPFIKDIGKILISFLLPFAAYGYMLFRSEARKESKKKLKNEGVFLTSLITWLLALWLLLHLLWNTEESLMLEDFNYCMDLLNSAKLFFFALYIPVLFPEPKEKNES